MAGPELIEWRRAFPSRAVGLLAWYVGGAAVALGLTWMLFGDEPERLDNGEQNPLAAAVPLASLLTLVGAAPFVLRAVRRPVVAASHYALTVRPGALRTLVLPWARIARVVVYRVGGEPYLLVRGRRTMDPAGDHPTWIDRGVLRAVLREAGRAATVVADFDLAVRMRDFIGEPHAQLATLAAFAPDHVLIGGDVEV